MIEVLPGYNTPGWSDPLEEKLPYFGLSEDLTGMRVLDIGWAEGFFSFDAERRGAREVIDRHRLFPTRCGASTSSKTPANRTPRPS
jgi:hypothetical protein